MTPPTVDLTPPTYIPVFSWTWSSTGRPCWMRAVTSHLSTTLNSGSKFLLWSLWWFRVLMVLGLLGEGAVKCNFHHRWGLWCSSVMIWEFPHQTSGFSSTPFHWKSSGAPVRLVEDIFTGWTAFHPPFIWFLSKDSVLRSSWCSEVECHLHFPP